MKTRAILAAIAILAVSCVKSEYDDKNTDKEISVLPGVSVKVNKSLQDISPESLIIVGGKTMSVDSKGNYKIVSYTAKGGDVEYISADSFNAGQPVALSSEIELGFENMPDFLSKDSFSGSLSNPVLEITVNNETGSDALLNLTIEAGSEAKKYTGIAIPTGKNQKVAISDNDFKSLFRDGVPEKINIKDMSLSKTPTKAGSSSSGEASDKYQVSVGADCEVPMTFDANTVAVFDYTVDFDKETLSINSLEGIQVGTKVIEFTGTVWNTIPLSVKFQAKGLDADKAVITKEVTFNYTDANGKVVSSILAGTPGNEVATNFTVRIKSDSDLLDMKYIQAVIEATNSTDQAVSLNEAQVIKFHFNDATFEDGINVKDNQ